MVVIERIMESFHDLLVEEPESPSGSDSRETNPGLWLEDYRLACQAGGVDNDDFIIRNLPLFLADSARAWLEHLPSNKI